MKKIFFICVLSLLLLLPNVYAGEIDVYINNEKKILAPAPLIIDGSTLVPMRAVFEALEAQVLWEPHTRTAIGLKGNTKVLLQIDKKIALINEQSQNLPIAARIINDRIFVPLRFVGEAFDFEVNWEASTKTVRINPPNNLEDSTKNINADALQDLSAYEALVVELVNQERAKAGLSPLKANKELAQVARIKSEEMRDKKYFSHQSPTFGSPFQMMQQFGISYRAAGENIAAGQTTPANVVTSWMNSPGHRANILNSSYTEIGVGLATGGAYGNYWTQMFIQPK